MEHLKQKNINDVLADKLHSLRPILLQNAFKLTGHTHDAEDLLQDTLLVVLNNSDKYDFESSSSAGLLYTIMKNTYINGYRRKKRKPTLYISELSLLAHRKLSNDALSLIGAKEIMGEVLKLNDCIRAPFQLYLNGYKYEEISASFGKPLGTIKSYIFKAKKQLAHAIIAKKATENAKKITSSTVELETKI